MELFLDTEFQIGQTIKGDFKIFAITNYSIVDLTRVALVTENSDKSRLLVIDEETALFFLRNLKRQ